MSSDRRADRVRRRGRARRARAGATSAARRACRRGRGARSRPPASRGRLARAWRRRVLDRLERERVVAERVVRVVEERRQPTRRTRRSAPVARLAVARRRRRARSRRHDAPRSVVSVRSRTARGAQRHCPVGQLHGGRLRLLRACSSGDRACASGAQGRRFDSCQAHRMGRWRRAAPVESLPCGGMRGVAQLTGAVVLAGTLGVGTAQAAFLAPPATTPTIAAAAKGRLALVSPTTGIRVVLPEDASQPSWSPNGRTVAFVRGDDIYTLQIQTNTLKRLTNTPNADSGPAWSPNGAEIAWSANNDIRAMNANGNSSSASSPAARAVSSSPPGTLTARRSSLRPTATGTGTSTPSTSRPTCRARSSRRPEISATRPCLRTARSSHTHLAAPGTPTSGFPRSRALPRGSRP